MTDLEEALGRRRRGPILYGGAALFTLGLLFVGIGALSVVYDAFAPTMAPGEAALWASTVTGLAIPLLLSALVVIFGGRDTVNRAGVGIGLSVAGVGLAWLLAPVGWSGGVAAAFAPAVVVYVSGLVGLQAALFGVALDRRRSTPSPGPGRVGAASRGTDPRAALGDGGEDGDRLNFLQDEDDDSERL